MSTGTDYYLRKTFHVLNNNPLNYKKKTEGTVEELRDDIQETFNILTRANFSKNAFWYIINESYIVEKIQ